MKKLFLFCIAIICAVLSFAQDKKTIIDTDAKFEIPILEYISQSGETSILEQGKVFIENQRSSSGTNIVVVKVYDGEKLLSDKMFFGNEVHIVLTENKIGSVSDFVKVMYNIEDKDNYLVAITNLPKNDSIPERYIVNYKGFPAPRKGTKPSTQSKIKVLSGNFEISKKVEMYKLDEDNFELAAEGVTYHIEQKDFNTAGKTVRCWFEKDGEVIAKRSFTGKDLEVVQMNNGGRLTYAVRTEDFMHAIMFQKESTGKYTVSHYTEER